jgi:hypothetical protein
VASGGVEQLARQHGFDPRQSVLLSDVRPKDASPRRVVAAVSTLLQAADAGAGAAGALAATAQLPSLERKRAGNRARGRRGAALGDLKTSAGQGRQARRVGVAKCADTPESIPRFKDTPGGVLIELDGSDALAGAAAASGADAHGFSYDAAFPVKLLLQLFKHNRHCPLPRRFRPCACHEAPGADAAYGLRVGGTPDAPMASSVGCELHQPIWRA